MPPEWELTLNVSVINYGPPNDIESYVQAFGRVGRDGMNSEALLLFYGRQL